MMAAQFSRSGRTGHLGKNICEIKTQVSEEVVNALTESASLNGVPKAEAHRTMLEDSLFGRLVHLPRHYMGRQSMDPESALSVLAALKGMTPQQYLERVVITEHLFGRLHADRLLHGSEEEQSENMADNVAAQGEAVHG